MGGGRTGHGCGRQPLQGRAVKAAFAARPSLQGLPTAPILGGAEGGLQGGSAKRAYHGEGSGVESPRAKRKPTNKDLTAFRGGGRGRVLLWRFCPLGLYRHNKTLSGGDCREVAPDTARLFGSPPPWGEGARDMGAGGSPCRSGRKKRLSPPAPGCRGYRLRPFWVGQRGACREVAPKRHLCPRITGAKGVNMRYA